jgi:hypothetical protein
MASITFESVFVGIYCVILYLILNPKSPYEWFVLGFIKHYAGYYIKIHDYYCKYSFTNGIPNRALLAKDEFLVSDSIWEGVIFALIGPVVGKDFAHVFVLGFMLHLVSEFIGIHKWFIKDRCVVFKL